VPVSVTEAEVVLYAFTEADWMIEGGVEER
jgi:hypothetical protein